jgi:hypothetical protein
MAEDLGSEDVTGLVRGFEAVAADGAVGAAQVAWFPVLVQRSREPKTNVLGELRAGDGVDGLGGSKGSLGSELSECADDLFWLGQNEDGIEFEACSWSLPGFQLALSASSRK